MERILFACVSFRAARAFLPRHDPVAVVRAQCRSSGTAASLGNRYCIRQLVQVNRRRSLFVRLGGLYFFAASEEEDSEELEDLAVTPLVSQEYS